MLIAGNQQSSDTIVRPHSSIALIAHPNPFIPDKHRDKTDGVHDFDWVARKWQPEVHY